MTSERRSTEEENKELVRRFIEAINNKRFEVVRELFSPDFRGFTAGDLEPKRGHAGVERAFNIGRQAIPDFRVEVQDLISDGDRVALRCTLRGTHRGELAHVAPTGKPIEMTCLAVGRVEAGRFVEGTCHSNAQALVQREIVSQRKS
jgi:predicted ester cyclase